MVKLNVYLSRCGVASRRKADTLIKNGAVSINGKRVFQPYIEVDEDSDIIKVFDKRISLQKKVYLALNKPEGYTSTLKDRFATLKVTDLIPPEMGKVFPAGRLDKNSTGLIILTTDGDFAQSMTHPAFEVEKEYEVTVTPVFDPKKIYILKKGILDEGERLKAHSGKMIKNLPLQKRSLISIVMKEGKKREVRRMFERLNYTIISLERVRIGNILLGGLKPGEYRPLSQKEISFFLKRTPKTIET